MAMLIISILYLIVFLIAVLSGIFVIYHIIRYSYNKTALLFMLLIFSSVMGVLVAINAILFFSVDFSEILSEVL